MNRNSDLRVEDDGREIVIAALALRIMWD